MTKTERRFWSLVKRHTPEGCWIFGSGNINDYGTFGVASKSIKAHRFAWEFHHKCKVPKGMYILHKCDNPKCVNPDHLYCGNQFDNMEDRKLSGNFKITNPAKYANRVKLSSKDVKSIKELYATGDFTRAKLGKLFNISPSVIQGHLSGRLKHTIDSYRSSNA